jgi:hypothetical protein
MTIMHMKSSREDYLAQRVDELRADLLLRDPALLAANTGANFSGSHFELPVWGKLLSLDVQDFIGRDLETGQPVDGLTQAILAYYLHTADGTPPSQHWIAFSGLPDGKFYTTAFQGYTGHELAGRFGNDLELFKSAVGKLGGTPHDLGDASFIFQVLPLVPILAVGWQGDEDFAPSYRLLFDSKVSHHLPTDACAILGSTLTKRLIKAAGSQNEL